MKNIGARAISKVLIIGAAFALISTSAATAFGIWAFNTETSDSASIDYEADPVPENTIFADGYDYADTGARSYDVYFMSQMCDITEHILTPMTGNNQTITVKSLTYDANGNNATKDETVINYQFRDYPVPYPVSTRALSTYVDSEPTGWGWNRNNYPDNTTAYEDFGMWMDPSSTDTNLVPLSNDVSDDQNRFFKRYQSVKELSADVIAEMGEPYVRLSDTNGWDISFLTWTPCYNLPVYYYSDSNYGSTTTLYPTPKNRQQNHSANNTNYNRRVTGYSPYSNVFTSLYAGTLLEYYERMSADGISYTPPVGGGTAETHRYVWYINGRPSIFFFPTYTSDGKNYADANNRKDAIKRFTFDPSTGNQMNNELFAYDGVFTETINQTLDTNGVTMPTGVRFECYRLPRVIFDDTLDYAMETDTNKNGVGWGGSWTKIYDVFPSLVKGDYINVYFIVKIDTATDSATTQKDQTTDENGHTVTLITNTEHDYIDEALSHLGVTKYYSRGRNGNLAGGATKYELATTESRDYYVVYERLYEPKLTGGPQGDIVYENNDHRFIKQGVTDQLNHNMIVRNVNLSGREPWGQHTYTYNGHEVTVHYPSTYFGVLLCDMGTMLEQDFNYDMVTGTDRVSDPSATPPTIDTSGNVSGTEDAYFKSSSIFTQIYSEDNPDYVDTYNASTVEAYVQVDGGDPITLKAAEAYGIQENFKMMRMKVGQEGTYTIMFQIAYEERTKYYDANGNEIADAASATYTITREVPNILTVWGYSFSDKFINICDLVNDPDSLQKLTETGSNQYVNTGVYTWGSENIYFGAYLSSNTKFFLPENRSEGQIYTTLGEILTDVYSRSPAQHMVDLVTGQIITSDNVDDFYVERYCVFVIKEVTADIAYWNA